MNEKTNVPFMPPVFLVRAMDGIREGLSRTARAMFPPGLTVFEMTQQYMVAKAISVAAELGIADALRDGPKNVQQLSSATNTHAEALYRVMRLLAAHGIFREHPRKTFSLTRLSRALINGPGSMRNMVIMHNHERMWNIFGDLKYTVRTGICASRKVYGKSGFDTLLQDPDLGDIFNAAMSETSDLSVAALLGSYSFAGLSTAIDLGGGAGYLLCSIAQRYPKLTGTVVDLATAVKGVPQTAAHFGVSDRIVGQSGSFFDKIPSDADAYILKNILHGWDDETSITICRNIREAMNGNSRLVVIECVIEENSMPSMGKFMDVTEMLTTDGGRERTRAEFTAILDAAGFAVRKVVATVAPFSVIEAVKKE